jgi:hypothetical protein
MSEDVDQRTGQPYEGKAFNGHGEGCLCPACIEATMSDLVEAGLLAFSGISENGRFLLQLHSEGTVDWREVFKRYLSIVSQQVGQAYLRPSDWTRAEWEAILAAGLETKNWDRIVEDEAGSDFRDD